MYVCGPTTYNFIHLGNARPLVFFDTVRRYLAYRGYDVLYVQNFTDVDDKIINRAGKKEKILLSLARKYIDEYFKDADALNVRRGQASQGLRSYARYCPGCGRAGAKGFRL